MGDEDARIADDYGGDHCPELDNDMSITYEYIYAFAR